jgi:hypothetical protein
VKRAILLVVLLAVIFGVPLYAPAAQLPCTVTINADGSAAVSCAGAVTPAPQPTPAPAPVPTPAPAPPAPASGNVVMQPLFVGGANNYVFDSTQYTNPRQPPPGPPAGTIQSFAIPQTWPDGRPIESAGFGFASFIVYTQVGALNEVSISQVPGDFESYKNAFPYYKEGDYAFYPCGLTFGPDFAISFTRQGTISSCKVPAGEQWYLNWRVHNCPGKGYTCGQTFTVNGQ